MELLQEKSWLEVLETMELWKEKSLLEVLETMELLQEKSQLEVLETMELWQEKSQLEQVKVVAHELERFIVEGQETLVWRQMNRSYKNYQSSLKKKWFKPYEEDPDEALEILPPNMADDDWNYLVNLWSNKDWKREKTGEDPSRLQLFEITHTRSKGQATNETTQEALMKFKRLTTEVAEGSLQMSGNEMFVEVFRPEHHGRVRGYGDGISPIEFWGFSSSTIRDLHMQLKESEERRKENDANLLRQLKESKERSKENDDNLLRKLKESEEHRKESDANVQLLKAQVNRVESLLAQALKNMVPFELAQFSR